jgi:hypothetical protein
MKLTPKTLSVGLALGLLVTAPIAFATAPSNAQHQEGKADSHEEGGLDSAMQAINGAVKRMNKALEKGDLDAIAKTAVDMQKAVLAAKTQTPEKAGAQSDAKAKAAFVLGFRKQMIAMERALLDVETAALDGKAEDAKKIFNETILPMKKEGHGKYKD